jgi:hypothetical protein
MVGFRNKNIRLQTLMTGWTAHHSYSKGEDFVYGFGHFKRANFINTTNRAVMWTVKYVAPLCQLNCNSGSTTQGWRLTGLVNMKKHSLPEQWRHEVCDRITEVSGKPSTTFFRVYQYTAPKIKAQIQGQQSSQRERGRLSKIKQTKKKKKLERDVFSGQSKIWVEDG